jgi:hypothetical protein
MMDLCLLYSVELGGRDVQRWRVINGLGDVKQQVNTLRIT